MKQGRPGLSIAAQPHAGGGKDTTDWATAPSLVRAETQVVRITSLRPGYSPRLAGEDVEHARLLAEAETQLPPILVHHDTMRVIDGMHRLNAAILRGRDTIEVQFFEGTADDAFLLAVRANTTHGLPLSLADRRSAAGRILRSHPSWSDRAVAAVTGLSPRSVRTIRARTGAASPAVTGRLGRDGRIRPLDAAAGRIAAAEAIARNPDASLRQIAKTAGISPSTVRDVRARILRGEDPVPVLVRPRPPDSAAPVRIDNSGRRETAVILDGLRHDPSLRFTDSGRTLLRWLLHRSIGPGEWSDMALTIPPHCACLVAELAHQCADEWRDFAEHAERRARMMA